MSSQVAAMYVKLTADIGEFEKKMASAENRFDKVGQNLVKTGKSMIKAITLPLVGAGVAILKMSSDFDQAMRNVNSVLLLGEDQFESMYDSVLKFSMTTRAGAVEVAEAMLQISQAGFRGDEAFELMTLSSRAAGAAFTSADDMARLLIMSIRAYGMEVDDATGLTDLFIYAMQSGAGSVTEMANSFAYVIPTAAMAGVAIEEAVAALAVMHKGGLSTSESVTALNNMLLKLIKPSEKLTRIFNEAGYESATAAISVLGLSGTMKLLQLKTGGSIEQLAAMFPHIRALRGALMLTADGATALGDAFVDLKANSEGAMESARNQQYKSLQSQLLLLKGAVEVVAIVIGSVFLPLLVKLAEQWIPRLIFWIEHLNEEGIKQVVMYAAVAAAIGPVIFVVGKIVLGIKTFIIMLKGLAQTALLTGEVLSTVFSVGKTAVLAFAKAGGAAIQGIEMLLMRNIPAAANAATVAAAGPIATFGAIATVAGVLSLAIGAVAIAGYNLKTTWDKLVAGGEEVRGAFNKMLRDMQKEGKTAAEIADEYTAALARQEERMISLGPTAELLVGPYAKLTGKMSASMKVLNAVLAQTSASYENYKKAAYDAGIKPTELLSKAAYKEAIAMEVVAGEVSTLAENTEWWAAVQAQATAEAESTANALASDEAIAALLKAQFERLSAQLELTASSMEAAGVAADVQRSTMDKLLISMDRTSEAEIRFRNQTELVAKAFGEGLITMGTYVTMLDQIEIGVFSLSPIYERWITNSLEAAAATKILNEKSIELIETARGEGILTLEESARLTEELAGSTMVMTEAMTNHLKAELKAIETAKEYNDLMIARGKLFSDALGSDLANLIQQNGQFVTVQASSVEQINDTTIAAFKASEAFGKWQEALKEQAENSDDDQMLKLGAAVASTHNAYLKAAEGAGLLNEALTEGYSFTSDLTEEIRDNMVNALFEQAKAADAPIESLILLAAATGEWDEAQVSAALKAAAMNEQIAIMGKRIADGSLSVESAIVLLDQLWEDMSATPPEQAFDVKVNMPDPLDPRWMADYLGVEEDDGPFAELEASGVAAGQKMQEDALEAVQAIKNTFTKENWYGVGENIHLRVANGFSEKQRLAKEALASGNAAGVEMEKVDWESFGYAAATGVIIGWQSAGVAQVMASGIVEAIEEAKAAAQTESPSKKMAWIGSMMAKGLEQGWNETVGGVQSAFDNDVSTMVGGPNNIDNSNNSRTTQEDHYHLHVEGERPRESLIQDYQLLRASRIGG